MRTPTSRRLRMAAALAGMAALAFAGLGLGLAGGASADVKEPAITDEAWFFRTKPNPPVVDVPCTPLPNPCGPISPGPGFPPAPQAPDGSFVTSFAGGNPGDGDAEGDTGWQAYQWDVFDAVGGTVDEFVVTFTQDPVNRGDFNEPQPDGSGGKIRACNIVGPWAGAPTGNPWPERPTNDCSTAVVPSVATDSAGRLTYTFDLTSMATKWIEGAGFGVVIRPGAPGVEPPLEPFQVTFAGYGTTAPNPEEVRPRATFRFQPADLSFDGDFDLDLGGGFDGGFDGGSFSGGGDFGPQPDLEVFPTPDSPELDTTQELSPNDSVTPRAQPRTVPASAEPGFPWLAAALLAGLASLAFWGTGTALGPAGDPLAVRQGGVSRVLAERRAARVAGDLPPIDR